MRFTSSEKIYTGSGMGLCVGGRHCNPLYNKYNHTTSTRCWRNPLTLYGMSDSSYQFSLRKILENIYKCLKVDIFLISGHFMKCKRYVQAPQHCNT